jgi:hypothetical protein
MKFGFAFVANYAEPLPDGKFSVVSGGLDGYLSPSLPTVVHFVSIVAGFKFSPEECDKEYEFGLSLIDPDGLEFALGAFKSTPRPDPYFAERPGSLHAVFNVVNWKINKYGFYYFQFSVDGERIGSMDFAIAPGESTGTAGE